MIPYMILQIQDKHEIQTWYSYVGFVVRTWHSYVREYPYKRFHC